MHLDTRSSSAVFRGGICHRLEALGARSMTGHSSEDALGQGGHADWGPRGKVSWAPLFDGSSAHVRAEGAGRAAGGRREGRRGDDGAVLVMLITHPWGMK
jgi:hypothetical protein